MFFVGRRIAFVTSARKSSECSGSPWAFISAIFIIVAVGADADRPFISPIPGNSSLTLALPSSLSSWFFSFRIPEIATPKRST